MSAMQNLADADAAELTAAERAEILRMLEQLDAVETVARSRVLNVFDANDDFELDGHRSVSAWLVNETGITKAEAGGHREWAKTVAGFPVIAQAMVDRVLRKSPVRKVCSLLAKIPAEHRAGAEQIIVQAAGAGAVLRDLVYLAAEIAARIAPLPGDGDEAGRVKDGNLRLETTLDGAGVLRGELSSARCRTGPAPRTTAPTGNVSTTACATRCAGSWVASWSRRSRATRSPPWSTSAWPT
jgi:hypothetical protein